MGYMAFSKFLWVTAIYNALLGFLLISSNVRDLLGVELLYPGNQMIAGFLWFTTIVLLISSSNVRRYASIIYYEALLRFFAAGVLLIAVLIYDFGFVMGMVAIGDVLIGMYYIVMLMKETPYDHLDLLTCRNV